MEIKNLQVVRGLAAMLVVATHFFGSSLKWFSPYLGHMGVDIFFTLSGFLMVYSQSSSKNAASFFIGRIKRIYPVYLILSLPMIIGAFGFEHIMYAVGNVMLIPGFNDPEYKMANYPAWSLVYEMIFYVIFSCSLLLRRDRVSSCLITVLVIFSVVWIFNGKYDKQGWVNLGYILGDQLLLNFAAGCLIALFYKKINVNWNINFYIFLVCTLTLLYMALHEIQNVRLVKLGIPSFLIIIIAIFSRPANDFFYRLLYLIGGASYSIYLSHLYWAELKPLALKLYGHNDMVFYWSSSVLAIVSIAFGIIFFKLVEQPIADYFRKMSHKNAVIDVRPEN
ncbi:acyltransferase [Cronobacter sakazakii]|uniref:acyltransferase family protein n=1 Tax=Cronobacter sakazakii TaxID=28141 RepID=UPI002A1866AE|nr:acyltransferase [Cronobacter sakazakii]ELY5880160.1 acyltransferase [Cronobacter sakazakii]ELY5978263.1 acyltransferase [Cronobacter sakazakii]MEB8628456.1 acyltransferase [Cronobacter sakazakii]